MTRIPALATVPAAICAALLLAGTLSCSRPQAPASRQAESTPAATAPSPPEDTATSAGGRSAPAESSREASLAEREQALAEREAELARREAALTEQPTAAPERSRTTRRPSASDQPPLPAPATAPSEATARTPAGSSAPAPSSPSATAPATAPVDAAAPAPAPVAEPAPLPRPSKVALTVPAGTELEVEFSDPLSSATSHAGDAFTTRLTRDVVIAGRVAIPAGSNVEGHVVEAVPLSRIGGRAKLVLAFDRLRLPSAETRSIQASFAQEGANETRRDAATIGGSAAGGAILGRILDRRHKGKGTILGALVGAAVGTAIAAKTEGEEVEIPTGTVVTLKLDDWVRVTVDGP